MSRISKLTDVTAVCSFVISIAALIIAINIPSPTLVIPNTAIPQDVLRMAPNGNQDGSSIPPLPMPNTHSTAGDSMLPKSSFLPIDHLVTGSDTLWDVAYSIYGDGSMWTRFSRSITGPNGMITLVPITDPRQLQVGWHVTNAGS